MKERLHTVFADAAYWIALVNRNDQYHGIARRWSHRLTDRIVTTSAVLTEAADGLARPIWRRHVVDLIDKIGSAETAIIVATDAPYWHRGLELYRNRPDKGWSLTDCISFLVMQDSSLTVALTSDEHYRQAGFRAPLLEEP